MDASKLVSEGGFLWTSWQEYSSVHELLEVTGKVSKTQIHNIAYIVT